MYLINSQFPGTGAKTFCLFKASQVEKGLATHSSILVWRIPWMKEPVGLQSVGSHKELDMTEKLTDTK